jgi:hypothetical protein
MSAVNTLGVGVAMKQAAGKGGIYEGKQGCGLVSVPLFHVTGSHAIFLAAVLQGSKLVLMFKWDVITALEHIQNEGVTGFTGVPTMWLDLVSHPDYDKYDTSTLKSIGGGGAAPPKKAGSDVAKKGTVFACPPQHALSTHIRTRSPLLLLPLPRPGNASIECGVIWSVALTCFNRVCVWVSFCRCLPGSGLGHDRDQRHHRLHLRRRVPRPAGPCRAGVLTNQRPGAKQGLARGRSRLLPFCAVACRTRCTHLRTHSVDRWWRVGYVGQ